VTKKIAGCFLIAHFKSHLRKEYMKYKINALIQITPKIFGISFYILVMPIIALMIIPTIFGLHFWLHLSHQYF